MRGLITVVLASAACHPEPLICGRTGSQTLFTANFNGGQAGTPPAPTTPLQYGPPGAGLNYQGTNNTVQVVNSPALGSQALQIDRGGGTATEVDAVVGDVGTAPYEHGVYYVDYRAHGAVMAPGLAASTSITVQSSAGKTALILRLSGTSYSIVRGTTFVELTGSYDPTVAHDVHLEIDLDRGRVGVCIDDERLVSGEPLWDSDFEDMRSLRFLTPPTILEAFPTSYVVDDVRVSTTPFDPSAAGPFPVGRAELDDPSGISGITDPTGTSGPTYPVTLAWAKIMYPASTAGVEQPVHSAWGSYPIALFLHGRHWDCDWDGDGPILEGSYTYPPSTCADADRIPSHEGYDYLLERLASHGIAAISISAHQIQHSNGAFNYDARGRLILEYLDKLRDWSSNGTDPFNALFHGRLDLSRVALSGHSRGGEGVVAAQELNLTWPTPHSIVAVNAIAPTDQNAVSFLMSDAPYYLLVGARDGDVSNMQGFRTYDRAYPDGMAGRHPKTVAWVHGANHNYFNTVWTDAAALGSPNPWAGAYDDAGGLAVSYSMPADEQRDIARITIVAFFRWHLQGIESFREIFTGRLQPPGMENQYVYWTFQDPDRTAVDDFEQWPVNKTENTLLGDATAPGYTTFEERLFNNDGTDYTSSPPADPRFFHDTKGLLLAWAAPQTYTTELPTGEQDVSSFTHLTLRAAKAVVGVPSGPPVNLFVAVEDGAAETAEVRTDQFDVIPHPYERHDVFCVDCRNQAQLVGVRIPLVAFVSANPNLDLTNIVRITIRTAGAGEIGIDDIEFGR